MAIQPTRYIWNNGKLKAWDEVTVHVLTHALHYGSSIFEGIRVYATPKGPQFFRLMDHMRRMFDSARIYQMKLPYSREQLAEACHMVVAENGLESAYVRPIAFCGYGSLGIDPGDQAPEVAIAAMEWGAYLGTEGLEKGVDVCVSSWNRVAPNTVPPAAKAGGNYLSSQLIHQEAKRNGYAEGIGLNTDGTVAEGSGENIFLVRDGALSTPGASGSILTGITRNTVFHLARELGYPVAERVIPREDLYTADEIFFVGTAAEITPVRSVDRCEVGEGGRGPITKAIQKAFFGLFNGATQDKWGWLEPVAKQVTDTVNKATKKVAKKP